jgi:ABC-type hemin transport system ATPase subunit
MLLFIDQPKHIRVVRASPDDAGTLKRERLGQIPKATLEVTPELSGALAPEESVEVSEAIDIYKKSVALKRQAAALAFPETVREVVDYLKDTASESERKIIVAALMEAVRLVRKSAREAQQGEPAR